MLKELKKNVFGALTSFYSLLVALFWLALRVNWAGISKALGADTNPSFMVMNLPLLICIFLWIAFIYSFVALLIWKNTRKWPYIVSLAISFVFTVAIGVIIALGSNDYIFFIIPKFLRSLLVSICIIAFALLLFFPTEYTKKISLFIKSMILIIVIVASVLLGYGFKPNSFTYGAAVFAVEDDYQIIFSTNDTSLAWVEIGDECYYDLYAGSMKSNDLVHKITVPQKVLDEAKEYTIYAQKMIYRGPFGGYKGKIISEKYNFKPVDSSDGLVYYCMTDVHEAFKGAINAANQVEDMDFLVILGDTTSMVDREVDAEANHMLANRVTKGEFPVVYARGNHEVKGLYAEDLYKYVGSKNQNFYFYFTLSDVYGIVLDLGEDHDDDWWEYYGTAQFVEYQNEQTEMLNDILNKKEYEDYSYRLVCSHIPINYVNYRLNHENIKNKWTELLNEFAPDNVVYGHQHDLYAFLEDTIEMNENHQLVYNSQFVGEEGKIYKGYVTDYKFNSFIVGKRGLTQTDEPKATNRVDHIGMVTKVDFAKDNQKHWFVNSNGEIVKVYNPFVEGSAVYEYNTSLKTKQ